MYTLPLPPVEVLNELLHYNPETGALRWKIDRGPRIAGQEAGSYTRGYKKLTINGKNYLAHRIVWKMVYGEDIPDSKIIDHINMVKGDNRLCNLRLVSYAENRYNQLHRQTNISGVKYISWRKDKNLWRIKVKRKIDGQYKTTCYGHYKTLEEAKVALAKLGLDN